MTRLLLNSLTDRFLRRTAPRPPAYCRRRMRRLTTNVYPEHCSMTTLRPHWLKYIFDPENCRPPNWIRQQNWLRFANPNWEQARGPKSHPSPPKCKSSPCSKRPKDC